MPFRSPLSEIRFLLDRVAGLRMVAATDRFAEATPDLVDAILSEAARLSDSLAPLNRAGDLHPARLENGAVVTPPGFADGYRAIAEGGWIGLSAPSEWGGQGLPQTLAVAFHDMLSGACLALELNPLMTQGAIEALARHASPELRALCLPPLVSGEWCGTMNLTEGNAGSDVGALRTRAEPRGDGTYAVTGEKIYITWADNDFAANICHLVLARLPDGVPGTKGISLFLVPKLLPGPDGRPGPRNALRPLKLEHKMGLHGSPTATMSYEGATGWLVGPPHGGMAAMFTMMNAARLGVGIQAIGAAEAALQMALDWALTRRQGRAGGTGTIIEHPDVRRMLAESRADLFGARAIALDCAVALDMAEATGDPAWAARAALLTPIAKAHGTDTAFAVADTAIQVQGGIGYIEETGTAQILRDLRVTRIYEGTNGIQALDLAGRKLADGGEAAFRLIDETAETAARARDSLPHLAEPLWQAAESLREGTEWMLAHPDNRGAGATSFLAAFALVLAARAHLVAALADPARAPLAAIHIRRRLPLHAAHLAALREGGAGLTAVSPEALAP
ncbi:acyl-CoA dehydrogenase family protein [Rubellimicrobium sp. CFH 75288]|uniref:acyl-CoA dehydrogenase family protein n=1 Tax=Rubellimicrobium sp. CFH 75288 TaxID=2697034 RepID=UPI001412948C|nr:acyl-CoA dehydrogenase family protein [Rubellimicrobium sp. CFH 75288]NAZ37591.1 acyl-CoA dehydrogenase [Rubellimicrobium sp. CFH 75288]